MVVAPFIDALIYYLLVVALSVLVATATLSEGAGLGMLMVWACMLAWITM